MYDVTIRGAGIFGLSVAWSCARRGAAVQIVDPGGPGAGASGGVVGALAPHVPENWNPKKAFQFESLILAETFWQTVEATGGVSSGYGRTGRLQPITDDHQLALALTRATGSETMWQGKARWSVKPAADFGSWCPSTPTGQVIHDTLSARLHPRQACASLSAALTVMGVPILSEGSNAGAVIWATGAAGLQQLADDLGKPVGGSVKGQAAVLRHNAGAVPQIFAESLHFIPHGDGTLAIGSTSERDFQDPQSTDAQLDDLLERATSALPLLHGAEVIERWAGLRPRARTRSPMLGAWPGRDRHFVANGGFKIGFGMAPKIAEVMADLVLEGTDTIPEGFRVRDNL